LLAVLALGAEGMLMGSRMTVSKEIWADEKYKTHITSIDQTATRIVMSVFNDHARVLDNHTSQAVNDLEKKGITEFEQYRQLVEGENQRSAYETGNFERGTLSMGQSCVFADRIMSVSDIFDEILADAKHMRDRLETLNTQN
jgi:nitronate monooxygenase